MRAFLAIELSDEVRATVDAFQRRLKATQTPASWVKPENFHLTLRFLGEVSAQQANELSAQLREAYTACSPLRLSLRGAGAFPNLRRPAVLWAGIQALEGDLEHIQHIAEDAARSIGLVPEAKPFHPHVTVGRIKKRVPVRGLEEVMAEYEIWDGDDFPVNAVALFQSCLGAGGAVYRRIEVYPFHLHR